MAVIAERRRLRAAAGAGAFAAAMAACMPVDMNEASIPSPVDAADSATTFMVVNAGGTEMNPVVDVISDGSALETAAGGLLLKIAARALLTPITGSLDCARAVTATVSTIGAVNNALSLAGVAHPVSGAFGAAVALARFTQDPGGCRFAPPPSRQQREPETDNRG